MPSISAYDYHLESTLLQHASHASCLSDCLQSQRTSTFILQLKSTTYGSVIILATNAVVVGWVVALLGGRLSLDRARDRDVKASGDRSGLRGDGSSAVAAAALVGAAAIHAAVVPEHLTEWPTAGVLFVVLAGAQAGTAVALLLRPGLSSWSMAVATSSVPLVIWFWSRTVGLPWGPEAGISEPLGLADEATVGLQGAALLLVLVAVRAQRRLLPPQTFSTDTTRIALAGVVAVTALGLGGSGIGWLDVTSDASGAHSASR